jgi:hypothetical protein
VKVRSRGSVRTTRTGPPAVRLLLFVAVATTAKYAAAELDLEVTRENASEGCPDAAELRRLTEASGSFSSTPAKHSYRVSFERSGGAYRAEIVDATSRRKRRLEDVGPRCAPLGQAVAVVLATMWSSEREEEASRPEPSPVPVRQIPSAETGFAAPALPPRAGRSRWVFGAGGGVAAAIVRPVAPAFLSDAAFEYARGAIALGVLWIPEERLALAPGIVSVQLVSGSIRGCGFVWEWTRLGMCGTVFGGVLEASGSGYKVDVQRTRPWFAAALEVFVDGPLPVSVFRYRAAAGAVVPLHAETFFIAGVGPAYDTPAVGGLFTLSVEVRP